MPIFRLQRYPFVCRLCLNPEQAQMNMTLLDTEDECLEGGTIEDFLATFTYQVEEPKRHLFPRSICAPCMDLFRMFVQYQTQVRTVHLFMNALVELRDSNPAPTNDLFQTKPDTVRAMLAKLDLCHKADVEAEDLIAEFPELQIAQLPSTLKDEYLDEDIDVMVELEPEIMDDFEQPEADHLLAEGLKNEIVHENMTFEDVKPQLSVIDQDVRYEFIADRDEKVSEPTRQTLASEAKQAKKRRKYKPKPKELLQCPKCPYQTTRKTHYNSHQRTHLRRENRIVPCTAAGCTEKFSSKKALQKHMVEAKHVACVCETCGYQCSSNGQMKDHLQRFHGNDRLACEFCQKIFKMKQALQEHVKTVHRAECVYKCETCGLEYRRKIALQRHQVTHSDVYNFPCQQCDKKFKLKTLLHKHTLTVHREAKLECEHCHQMFHMKFKLLDHIENAHGIRMRFFCDVCVASFDSQENLAIHKARHENPKNLECGRCLLVLPDQDQMLNHVCITYRDDYVCCGRDLRYHVQYNKHMLVKHGVRVNARVKPDPNALLGRIRGRRKPVLSCSKCKVILPTRTKKKQHVATCGGEVKT